jgi:hypothetical protein
VRKSTLYLLLAALLATGVTGGWLYRHGQVRRQPAVEFESDMTESLLRGIFAENAASNPAVCFLAFGADRTSPDDAFIARFAGSRPAVRSFQFSVMPPTGKILETASGKPGLLIQIVSFKELITGTFDVVVTFSNLPPGHDRFTYRVTDLAGEWKIQSRKPA